MQVKDYLASLSVETAKECRATLKYLEHWQKYPADETFAGFLEKQPLSPATRAKHIRIAKTLCKRCNLDYPIGSLPTPPKSSPPKFADRDFLKLMEAFANCDWPKFIIVGERYRYWQTLPVDPRRRLLSRSSKCLCRTGERS